MNHRERIGQQITNLRKERGMTQEALAEASGIDRGNLSRIERGKYNVSIDILSKISDVLDCQISFVKMYHNIPRSKFNYIQQRPELLQLPKNRDVKFYFDEKEAYDNCPTGYRSVVHQWDFIIDDASDEELSELKQAAEDRIIASEQECIKEHGVNYVNDEQKELIRSLYNHKSIYSCWYKSDAESVEDLKRTVRFNSYDDNVDDDI